MSPVKLYDGSKRGGWIPDLPDSRDLLLSDPLCVLRKPVVESRGPDDRSDLRDFFNPVENQGPTFATTAVSCGGLVEYFNRRCRGKLGSVSKPFLYDVSRRMHGIHGDCGISIRQALKSLVRVGVPPRSYINEASGLPNPSFDPLLYSFAGDYQSVRYYRVEPTPRATSLHFVKVLLSLGIPCVFGMPLYATLTTDPRIDYRPNDEVIGGVSGVLVGHDDDYRISSRGALLFRSSWGDDWGDLGYGWISYRMIEAGLIRDIWTIFRPEWREEGDFSFSRGSTSKSQLGLT